MSQRFLKFGDLWLGSTIIDVHGDVRLKNSPATAITFSEQQAGEQGLPFSFDEEVYVDVESTLKSLLNNILMNASVGATVTIDAVHLVDATQFLQQIGEL
jgi:hypothetical protein